MADHTNKEKIVRKTRYVYYHNRNGDLVALAEFQRLFAKEVDAGNPERVLEATDPEDNTIVSVCVYPPFLYLP